MTVKGADGPWKVDPVEAELRDLTARLQDANRVLGCWKRRGGGTINAHNVLVRMPGEPAPRETTDAELVVIRSMERQGTLLVSWPFRCMRPLDDHAPVDELIEAAASIL